MNFYLLFQTTELNKHIIIQAKSRLELSKLTFNSAVKRIQGSLSTLIDIYTNVTVFTVPVHVYDGKLQVRMSMVLMLLCDFYACLQLQRSETHCRLSLC